ncbi:hypothetical protein GCM10009854_10370 [Saccharopolyspora halophila]|uniref:Uncharacterized protein n=1 Tax=Saccharopolyspora halophila TaxID=405551 RepID=A0ABN3FS07_9PSEU
MREADLTNKGLAKRMTDLSNIDGGDPIAPRPRRWRGPAHTAGPGTSRAFSRVGSVTIEDG